MAERRLAVLVALAACALAVPRAVAAPAITPRTLQCDGSYVDGGSTHHPTPDIRVAVQDTIGLRVGTYPLGIIPGQVRSLYRFDTATVHISSSCGGANQWRFDYNYVEPNGSTRMVIGSCLYNSDAGCTTNSGLNAGGSRNPLGLGSCPASVPPLSSGLSAFSLAGPNANFGTAADFSAGQDAGFVIYEPGQWDLNINYTLTAWVRPTAVSGVQRIISQELNGKFWGMALDGAGLQHRDSRDSSATSATRGSTVQANAWNMVAVTRTNGVLRKFYINGVLVGTAVSNSSTSFISHPIGNVTAIGRASSGSGVESFTGRIDDVRVSDGALSDDEILLEYQGTVQKYSSDGGVKFSTSAGSYVGGAPADATQAAQTYLPNGAVTTNARWIFMGQSTRTVSTILSPFQVTIDNGAPVIGSLSGTPTGTNSISWTWTEPIKYCKPPGSASVTYDLYDCATGAALNPPGPISHPTMTVGETLAGTPNQQRCRQVRVTDTWGTSGLSNSASSYALAAAPTGLAFGSISTGSVSVSWNANSNPSYTRYELSYSPDNFTATVSTRMRISDDHTATSVNLGSLASGVTYFVRVRAFNGRAADASGGTGTSFLTGSFVTKMAAPALGGAPASNASIQWTWSAVPGAASYALYEYPSGALIASGGIQSATQSGLSVNTQYQAEVEALGPGGTGASVRSRANSFTLANPPASPSVAAAHSSSIAYTWAANGNPGYTFYEVSIATESSFTTVVTTLSVSGTAATASDLLPNTLYFARVRAVNGTQVGSSFASFANASTTPNAKITATASPNTPYGSASGLVGSWHFDEGSGTSVSDLSGQLNGVSLLCATTNCLSTPTFAAGPAGLGSAASFSGLAQGAARTASGTPFAFTDSLTVSAWVYPQSASQPNGAGIVARGNQGSEDFALDVSGGVFRFIATPAKIASVSTAVIPAGQWTHVAGVYDSGAGRATLFLNGQPRAQVTAVPARSDSGQQLVIGNRRSSAGSLVLPFFGRIDAVRVYRRALTNAEVVSEYDSSFISTVTPASPNSSILVALPPNALGAPAEVYVSGDPLNHPVKVPRSMLQAGLDSPPPGATMAPNTLVEIVPVVGGQPFTSNLGSSATVTIPYADANRDNLVDGTLPPLPANTLKLYTLNTAVNRWEELPSTVDRENRRVSGLTPHFSIFALFGASTVGSDLAGIRVYPVPWKPGSGDRFDAAAITFDSLPASGKITILSAAGQKVKDISFDGFSAGAAVWDGTNNHGRRVASGVYYARVKSDGGGSTLVKVAIER